MKMSLESSKSHVSQVYFKVSLTKKRSFWYFLWQLVIYDLKVEFFRRKFNIDPFLGILLQTNRGPFLWSFFICLYPGSKWKVCDTSHFKKIGLNQWNHLEQHKESLLLNLATVPPPPKTKKLCIFSIDLFINC